MSIAVLAANRFLKIIGNSSKFLCYGFHFLFPNVRFTLPEHSAPLIRSRRKSAIPKIVWQTNFTNRVTLPVYLNYLANRVLSPDHEYRFVGDDAQREFMQNQMPARIADAYNKLLDGAAKADMWRAAVLYKLGGTYIDIDAHLVWPLSRLIRPDDSELVIYNRNDYSNFFMAFAPNSVILKETIDMIVENIEENSEGKNVYFLTGPGTLNKALENKSFNYRVFRYVCIQGSFTNEYFQYMDRPGSKWIHKKPSEIMRG